jgi:hypothetical protein
MQKAGRQQSIHIVIAGPRRDADALKHSFLARPAGSDFIRSNHRHPTKTLLFLLAALTIRRTVAKSIIRSRSRSGRGFCRSQ